MCPVCVVAEGVAAHFGGYRAMTLTLLVIELVCIAFRKSLAVYGMPLVGTCAHGCCCLQLILVASMLAISNGYANQLMAPTRLARAHRMFCRTRLSVDPACERRPVVPSPERLASLAVRLLGPLYVCFTFAHGILLLPHKVGDSLSGTAGAN